MKVDLKEIIIKKDIEKRKKNRGNKDNKRDKESLEEGFMSDLDMKLPIKFMKLPGIVKSSVALMKCMFWDNISNVYSTLMKSNLIDGRPKFVSAEADEDLSFYNVKLKIDTKEDDGVDEIIKKLKSSVPMGRVDYKSEKTDNKREVILVVRVKLLGSNNCGKML